MCIIHMKPSQYNPRGLDSRKPIALRLMPDELKDAERVSTEAGISKAKLARAAYIKGLPLIEQELRDKASADATTTHAA